MSHSDHVVIFDTTLRDGEQCPGYSMNHAEKLRLAHTLRDLNVDVIEAGFAAASQGDFESINAIAKTIKGPKICSLARCNENDITKAGMAIEPAQQKRLHVFIATSPLHREFKLKMDKDAIIEAAVKGVKRALEFCDDVEFSAEDAIRTERDYLAAVTQAVIDAGATTVNIPDTVGYSTPDEIYTLFKFLKDTVPNIDKAILSAHCHDDLGMAVANSLAAVRGGARQIECTINGIGERAGNCSLEEAVMALKTRHDIYQADTQIVTQKLFEASQTLIDITGNPVARTKAIVGKNAFAHEAGIHQHGYLQNRETYEIMRPEDVGIEKTQLVLGKHSGRHALVERVKEMSYDLDDAAIDVLFKAFKDLADEKKEILDKDIEKLIRQHNLV